MKRTDIKVLNELRKNSRTSLTDIGYKLNMPLSTVFKKVTRLEKEIIRRYVSLLDFKETGYLFKVGAFLNAKNKEQLEKFLLEHCSINTLARLSGDYRYYAEFIFKNMREYQEFEEALEERKMVKGYRIHFMTDIKQEEFQIPLINDRWGSSIR